MRELNYGFLGYKNHSKKLLDIFLKKTKGHYYIYIHKKNLLNKFKNSELIFYTNDLKLIKKCDVIIISSPSKTHYNYLKYFKNNSKYIFCEKPGVVNKAEMKKLEKFKLNEKKMIYFNFNYIFSNYYNYLKKILQNKKYGNLVSIFINSSHGLFFKSKKKLRGRFNNIDIYENIYGNLGIHYINLLIFLFESVDLKYISLTSSNKMNFFDSVTIDAKLNNKINANIFLSYSTIFSQSIKLYFNNAMIEFKDRKVIEYFPRDNFDKDGNFCEPKRKILKKNIHLTKKSIENSVEYFLKRIKNYKKFELKSFQNMILTNEKLINSINKIDF